ncbi:MAG: hypothetical protein Kow0069_14820 [Promethearchaeota archaeon]
MKKRDLAFLRHAWALLAKDLKTEGRRLTDLASIVLFDVLAVFLFSAAHAAGTGSPTMAVEVFVVEVWVVVLFTVVFVTSKLFAKEKDAGTLGGLLVAPVSPGAVVLAKVVYGWLLASGMEVVLFVFGVVVSRPTPLTWPTSPQVLVAFALPTLDLCVCATFVSGVSVYARDRSFVLPLLLFPMVVPVVPPAVAVTLQVLSGEPLAGVAFEAGFVALHALLVGGLLAALSETLLSG